MVVFLFLYFFVKMVFFFVLFIDFILGRVFFFFWDMIMVIELNEIVFFDCLFGVGNLRFFFF